MMRVSIVVPSYRRPDRLVRSLAALHRQSRPPDEILVVCRIDDADTRAVTESTAGVRRIDVRRPGVLAAMRAGALACSGDCIGFVDDDAEPREGWLAGVVSHFDDPTVGAICGRDVIAAEDELGSKCDVGRITSAGKLVGNHHLGKGRARDVHVLKAANMVFRRPALALPDGLRGEGAEAHFEVATCLRAIAHGWRLVYDPALVVDHRAGPRFDADAREARSPGATANAAYNLTLCLGVLRPELRRRRLAYGLLVGDRDVPGLLRASRAIAARDMSVVTALAPSVRGQLAASRALHRGRSPLAMYTYPSPGEEVPVQPDVHQPL